MHNTSPQFYSSSNSFQPPKPTSKRQQPYHPLHKKSSNNPSENIPIYLVNPNCPQYTSIQTQQAHSIKQYTTNSSLNRNVYLSEAEKMEVNADLIYSKGNYPVRNFSNAGKGKGKEGAISRVKHGGSSLSSSKTDLGQMAFKNNSREFLASETSEQKPLTRNKLEYLKIIQKSFSAYEKTLNPNIIKQFQQKNKELMLKLANEIVNIESGKCHVAKRSQDNSSVFSDGRFGSGKSSSVRVDEGRNGEMGMWEPDRRGSDVEAEIARQVKKKQQLLAQIELYTQSHSKARQQNSKLEETDKILRSIEMELTKTTNKTLEYTSKLSQSPFYHEWMIMAKQAEGAKKHKVRLVEELEKRKKKIEEARTDNGQSQEKIGRNSQEKIGRNSQEKIGRSQEKIKSRIINSEQTRLGNLDSITKVKQ